MLEAKVVTWQMFPVVGPGQEEHVLQILIPTTLPCLQTAVTRQNYWFIMRQTLTPFSVYSDRYSVIIMGVPQLSILHDNTGPLSAHSGQNSLPNSNN